MLEEETESLRGQAAWLEQRTALARELHDVVGHHVTAMVVQAEAGLVGDPERRCARSAAWVAPRSASSTPWSCTCATRTRR